MAATLMNDDGSGQPAGNNGQLVMRWPKPFYFAIVDEGDPVLNDEGRNPLLISGEHYNIKLKDITMELIEEGIVLAEMALETKICGMKMTLGLVDWESGRKNAMVRGDSPGCGGKRKFTIQVDSAVLAQITY